MNSGEEDSYDYEDDVEDNYSEEDRQEQKKMITLRSGDNVEFDVEQAAAMMSGIIRNWIDRSSCSDNEDSDVILVTNVTGNVLSEVMDYCKQHVEFDECHEDEATVKAWDRDFIKGFGEDTDVLFDLILAADYLDIPELLDLLTQTAADMIKGKTPDQIREKFKIDYDFTSEEEAALQKENQWAF